MEPFKNKLSAELVSIIADHVEKHLPDFARASFEQKILSQLPDLELKQRTQLIANALHDVLPKQLAARNKILLAMLHPNDGTIPSDKSVDLSSDQHGIRGWGLWPLTMLVGQHGVPEFDGSLELLRQMTKRGTAEFDIRPFIIADQNRALAIIRKWSADENFHVRRLASEGTRPRLPWGMQLKALIKDPSPSLPILMALRDDDQEYVRRSVANHLNDIAKDHPDLVAEIASDWLSQASINRVKLVRHACRSLIKQGHPPTMAAFGLSKPRLHDPQIRIDNQNVVLGGAVDFSVTIASSSAKAQKIAIDYVVHFQKANGQLAPKTFKWTQFELQPHETRTLQRRHKIVPITTRKYYQGDHALSLRINGHDYGFVHFELRLNV